MNEKCAGMETGVVLIRIGSTGFESQTEDFGYLIFIPHIPRNI